MITKKLIFEIDGKVVETLNAYNTTLDDITLIKVAMAIKYSVSEDDVDLRTVEEDVSYMFNQIKLRNSRIQMVIEIARAMKYNLN